MTSNYDIIIVGASFSGLTLAHHLPKNLNILVVDSKPQAGATVESTGLITEHTRSEFRTFFDVDIYITNPITAICVMAPDFQNYFVSHTANPWIYQTDTKALVKAMAETLPKNVTLKTGTLFTDVENFKIAEPVNAVKLLHQGKTEIVKTRFLVGADGGRSKVAAVINADAKRNKSKPLLSQNQQFLFGYEQVFLGQCHLGPHPAETIYHFWFGEFSLGYGGWLSPTVINGKKAFRIGLAKLIHESGDALNLMKKFTQKLADLKVITIHGDINKPDYIFGSHIPVGGVLKKIDYQNVLLIGDAAGFCGAFTADGIKGSILSGKEGAKLIEQFLCGEKEILRELKSAMNRYHTLLHYYKKQLRYRWIWDQMRRNRTFTAMYKIIAAEKEHFLEQFCDCKEKRRSLVWTVFKIKHIPKLVKYSWFVLMDMLKK